VGVVHFSWQDTIEEEYGKIKLKIIKRGKGSNEKHNFPVPPKVIS
jgi:hypothetical protein